VVYSTQHVTLLIKRRTKHYIEIQILHSQGGYENGCTTATTK